jgi:hypothetical protein
MTVQFDEIASVEPDIDTCCTEEIISDLSRCSGNNRRCKYGLPAGATSTYCLHPDFRKFLVSATPVMKNDTGVIYKK